MKWVKENRRDGRISREFGGSPYVCDNLSRYPGNLDGFSGSPVRIAVRAVKADIEKEIKNRFSVAEFLGYDGCDEEDNYRPDVIAFREALVDRLIARYEAEAAQ